MRLSTASRVMLAVACVTALSSCSGLSQLLGTEFRAEPARALSVKPCPPLYRYSEREMAEAGAEMDRLGPESQLWRMMDHYLYMREACR